jgi:polyphosphate kinase
MQRKDTETLTLREAGSPIRLELTDNADAAILQLNYQQEGITAEMEVRLDPGQMALVEQWLATVRERRGL